MVCAWQSDFQIDILSQAFCLSLSSSRPLTSEQPIAIRACGDWWGRGTKDCSADQAAYVITQCLLRDLTDHATTNQHLLVGILPQKRLTW